MKRPPGGARTKAVTLGNALSRWLPRLEAWRPGWILTLGLQLMADSRRDETGVESRRRRHRGRFFVGIVECAAGLRASFAGFLLAGSAPRWCGSSCGDVAAPGDDVLRRGKRFAVLEDGHGRATACCACALRERRRLLADETAPEAEPAAGRIDCRVSPWGGSFSQRFPALAAELEACSVLEAAARALELQRCAALTAEL
jgi:hypothetical protein